MFLASNLGLFDRGVITDSPGSSIGRSRGDVRLDFGSVLRHEIAKPSRRSPRPHIYSIRLTVMPNGRTNRMEQTRLGVLSFFLRFRFHKVSVPGLLIRDVSQH